MAYTPPTPPKNFSIDSYKKKLGDPFKVIGLKRQLGSHLGKPYLSGAEAKHHLVSKLKEYSNKSYNKKQIIDKMKKEYSLKMDVAKALGNYLIPGKTGPSKDELEKIKERNLRMKFIVDVIGSKRVSARSGQSAGDKRKEAAEEKKQEMLAPRTPGYQKDTAEKSMGNLVVGPWSGKAEELTRSGDLEVKHIEGGTGLAGGKPTGAGLAGGKLEEGVASVIDLNKKREEKKSAENKKTGSKPDLQLAA